jgi:iron complex transport system ATP-binding protein
VIAVFQDLNLASAYSQEMVMVKAGRVVASGPYGRCDDAPNLKTVFDIEARWR